MKSFYAVILAVCFACLLHFSYNHFTVQAGPQPLLPQSDINYPSVGPETLSSESMPTIAPIDTSKEVDQPTKTIDEVIRNSGSSLLAPYALDNLGEG